MSIVPLSFLNPHWLSGRSPDCSRCSFNRFSRTLARIFPATDNKEMPRWLSQTWGFPFLLNRWIIVATLNSWVMATFLHTMWNNSVSFSATGGPPALWIFAGIASDPGALPDDRSFIAVTVSETVGSSSSSGLHSTCGSLLIASSLIDDGQLTTPSKCSSPSFQDSFFVSQGPVVQSVVSLTSSLRAISLTILADSIYNFLKFFAEKMWVAFAEISEYLRINRCSKF